MNRVRGTSDPAENPYQSPDSSAAGADRSLARWWIRSGNWGVLAASAAIQRLLWDIYISGSPLRPWQNIACLALLIAMAVLLLVRIIYRLRRELRRHF